MFTNDLDDGPDAGNCLWGGIAPCTRMGSFGPSRRVGSYHIAEDHAAQQELKCGLAAVSASHLICKGFWVLQVPLFYQPKRKREGAEQLLPYFLWALIQSTRSVMRSTSWTHSSTDCRMKQEDSLADSRDQMPIATVLTCCGKAIQE